jgi:uncharacterized repeat protein (TIGR01451 family)/CSLREA domain-containing protein
MKFCFDNQRVFGHTRLRRALHVHVSLRLFILIGIALLVAFTVSSRHARMQTPEPASVPEKRVTIHAADRGKPQINYQDGHELSGTDGAAASSNATPQGSFGNAQSVAAADFDEDGVADIICGSDGGRLALYRGNVDVIYSNSREAQARKAQGTFTREPFFSNAQTFDAPESSEVVTGDFNADGHQDVLAYATGSDSLYLLAGNGHGKFSAAQPFKMEGKITTVATGEFGHADDQTDVAIGLLTDKGALLVVYEYPEGATKAKPEYFKLPAPATEIRMGLLDEDALYDIAVACDHNLVFVHGHEQLYPWVQMKDSKIERPTAQVGRRSFPFRISALAVGKFANSRRQSIALLADDGSLHVMEAPAPLQPKKAVKALPENLLTTAIAPTGDGFSTYKIEDAEKMRAENSKAQPALVRDNSKRFDPEELFKQQIEERQKQAQSNAQDKANATAKENAPAKNKSPMDSILQSEDATPPTPSLKFAHSFDTAPSRLNEWSDAVWFTDALITNAAAQSNVKNILTPARMSGSNTDALVVLDGNGKQLHIVSNQWATGTTQAATKKTTSVATFDVDSSPVALLPMRLNEDAISDLVVLHNGASTPSVVLSAAALTLTVNTDSDDFGNCLNSSTCTLRDAIEVANHVAGTPSIVFDIPGGGQHTILLNSQLPVVTGAMTIDGTTQPGYGGYPIIEIKGSQLTQPSDGLKIRASNCTVRGLIINEMPGSDPNQQSVTGGNGLTLESTTQSPNNNSNIVENNFLGTDPTGTQAKGNKGTGINVFDSDENFIGNSNPQARNLISGNGVTFSTRGGSGLAMQFVNGNHNLVKGNYIGTNATGDGRVPNVNGILLSGTNNLFGGVIFSAGNVISGNGSVFLPYSFTENRCSGNALAIQPLVLQGTTTNLTLDNRVEGNRIGTTANGMGPLGNCGGGVFTIPVTQTYIGSITDGGRNVISGNGDSAVFCPASIYDPFITGTCTVVGNNIGTDIAGTASIPIVLPAAAYACEGVCPYTGNVAVGGPRDGYSVVGGPAGTTQGGSCTGFCNLISGSNDENSRLDAGGILDVGPVGSLGVFNNYIGTDVTGTVALPNRDSMLIFTGLNYVGAVFGSEGDYTSGGNLILDQMYFYLQDANNGSPSGQVYFMGNQVGTDVSGNVALPHPGIVSLAQFISGPTTFTAIGGPNPLERNVFSGSSGQGIQVYGPTLIRNNVIGRNRTEDTPIPNAGDGIQVLAGPLKIGGSQPGEQNVIANNGGTGIYIQGGNENWISANRIFQNGALGIDLEPLGVNPNDLFDLDEGANRKQNYPMLSPPVFNPDGTVTLSGTLNSAPNTRYLIGFFATQTPDPTQYGEGGYYQGSGSTTTNASGYGTFTFTTPFTFTPDISFTAIAQDPDRNTSEFSCVAGKCFSELDVSLKDDVDPIEAGSTLTYTSVVNNAGPAAAPNTIFADTLPTLAFNFISATATQGTCSRSGNQVLCDLGTLDVGASATITIKITPTQTGRITDKVQVASNSPDPNPTNNQATEDTEVTGPAIIVNRIGDEVDADTTDSVCDVDPNTPENQCTLRAAIQVANARTGRDLIKFDIMGAGVHTITPQTALPTISQAVLIDGTTQAGYSGTPVIELSGAAAGQLVNGLYITGGTTTVKALAINRFGGQGIFIQDGAGNIIESCMIGLNPTGTSALGNALSGIFISNSPNNTIGGATSAKRNVISANGTLNDPTYRQGVEIFGTSSTGNKVQGNYIGTNAAGDAALGNVGSGVLLTDTSGNTVGGTTFTPGTAPGNLISGNGVGVGIASTSAVGASNNNVQGNLIGLDASGATNIPNTNYGVGIVGEAQNNTVGGQTPGARNVISGNTQVGVLISGPPQGLNTANNKVQGNFIGTDIDGARGRANRIGIQIQDAHDNMIGGTSATARNLISGNIEIGLAIAQSSPDLNTTYNNTVAGNFIGTNADGSSSLYNGLAGVTIGNGAHDSIVGGNSTAQRNVISGNAGVSGGVGLIINTQAHNNTVIGNYIGTDDSGQSALKNTAGIGLGSGASGNNIGDGTTAGRNIISGNGVGIDITGTEPTPMSAPSGQPNSKEQATIRQKRAMVLDDAKLKTLQSLLNTSLAPRVDFSSLPKGLLPTTSVTNSNFKRTALAATPHSINATTGNTITGNYIGTDNTGSQGLGNESFGIFVSDGAQNTTISGRNVISGNRSGIVVGTLDANSPNKPDLTSITGNYIGTNAQGSASIGNTENGIFVSNASNTTIGAIGNGRNVISGNGQYGVQILSETTIGTKVQGNYIGTGAGGTTAVANDIGVGILDSAGNTIGGNSANSQGNLISGNTTTGVIVTLAVDIGQNFIQGNRIGTNALGTAAISGQQAGVTVYLASNVVIGGEETGEGNLISANSLAGVLVTNAGAVAIKGNLIGSDVTGSVAIGNTTGVLLGEEASSNTVGGLFGLSRNYINGNTASGIRLAGGATARNKIQHNYIGVTAANLPLGNGSHGIQLDAGAHDNLIGGEGGGNTIANNGGSGVALEPTAGAGNTIDPNAIFANFGLGIDLNSDGAPQPNDAGDADTGPNNLQNYPQFFSNIIDTGGNLRIEFKVDSDPLNSNYGTDGLHLEFFKADTNGQGKVYLGSYNYTVSNYNAGVNGNHTVYIPGNAATLGIAAGDFITATVTDADGNTSEFTSELVAVTVPTPPTPVNAGDVIISEFRTRGPSGSKDEFIELYNTTNTRIVVGSTDGSNGWAIAARTGVETAPIIVANLFNAFEIPAHGHFLLANNDNDSGDGYSLSAYASNDFFVMQDIPDGAGLALFTVNTQANFTLANRLDAVGFTSADPLYRKGAGLSPAGGITTSGQWSFARKILNQPVGMPQDTGDNANDFVLVATDGTIYNGVQSVLGAPGPESAFSLVYRDDAVAPSYIDPGVQRNAAPNRVRLTCGSTGAPPCDSFNSAQGFLSIRRRFTNTTSAPLTNLRFRIVDITTLGSAVIGNPQADLRALTSSDTAANVSLLGTMIVKGTMLEQPDQTIKGGGVNSSLSVQLPEGGLAAGESIDVQFMLGVMQAGNFRFFVTVEGTP